MTSENYKKFLNRCGIIETYIPPIEPTTKNSETWMKYTFSNGEEITLQFGPICMLDQIDEFEKRRDEILKSKIKWMKIKKIRELING